LCVGHEIARIINLPRQGITAPSRGLLSIPESPLYQQPLETLDLARKVKSP
jgi:hypothetical protein